MTPIKSELKVSLILLAIIDGNGPKGGFSDRLQAFILYR